MVSIRSFRAMVARALDRIPEPLLRELDAGVIVLEEARHNPSDPPDVHILGEYIDDVAIGRHVVLYYGSFRAILGDAPAEEVQEEITRTLAHELRHHVESLAGVDWLDEEDWEEIRRFRAEATNGGSNGRSAHGRRRPGRT